MAPIKEICEFDWPCRRCILSGCVFAQFSFQEFCLPDGKNLVGDGWFVDAPDGRCPPPLKYFPPPENLSLEGVSVGFDVALFWIVVLLSALGGGSAWRYMLRFNALVHLISKGFTSARRRLRRIMRAARQIRGGMRNVCTTQGIISLTSSSGVSSSSTSSNPKSRVRFGFRTRRQRTGTVFKPRTSTPLAPSQTQESQPRASRRLFRSPLLPKLRSFLPNYNPLVNSMSTANQTQSTQLSPEQTVIQNAPDGTMLNLSDSTTPSTMVTVVTPESKTPRPPSTPCPPATSLAQPDWELTPPRHQTGIENMNAAVLPVVTRTVETGPSTSPQLLAPAEPSTSGTNPFRAFSSTNPEVKRSTRIREQGERKPFNQDKKNRNK